MFIKNATDTYNAAILRAIKGDSAVQEVEAVVEGWYSSRTNYEFPGQNESFEACNTSISINEYGPFTQVRMPRKLP